MKKTMGMATLFGLSVLCQPAAAQAYDTEKYCREVSQVVGGSYQIEEGCRKQERQAQQILSRRQIPPRIEKYCREVGQVVGGSYQIMNGCVDQEVAAKSRL